MNPFRLFGFAARNFQQPLSCAKIWRQPYNPTFHRSLHSSGRFGSQRARTQWQTRFQRARANAQREQQRGYRRQVFNRQNVNATVFLFQKWAQRPTFYYEVGALGGACGIWYIYNLETVPVSGRRRFNAINEEYEKKLGQLQFQELLKEYQGAILPEYSREHQMAERVMERLIPHCGLEGQEWEVRVIKDDSQKNAFVLPGGKVFVFSGILSVCRDEDGLAAVLGHEVAHNVAHHAAEQTSRALILAPLGILAFFAAGLDPSLWRMFTSLAFTLPGSRRQEEEADYIGLLMMAESCYDPQAALRLWAAMEKEEQGRAPPQYMSTHPSSRSRLEKIQGWLGEAEQKREMGDCHAMSGYAEGFRGMRDLARW